MHSTSTTEPGLRSLVDELTNDDANADRQRRSVRRTPFVRPVSVHPAGAANQTMCAFSKNISPLGIGLILKGTLPDNTVADLSIPSPKGRQVQVRSELRWSQPFGEGWTLTGWKFVSELDD